MNHFRLKSAQFDFGHGTEDTIDFVATPTDKRSRQSHFTLLMGANGSYKSRALAGCIDLLRHQNSIQSKSKPENPSECCLGATIESDGLMGDVGLGGLFSNGDVQLPSRILALSNLVRDRFTFGRRGDEDDTDHFYHYLGVRQATNLTTTGAMDRIVADAFLEILPDTERRALLLKWIGNLFPKFELAFGFAHLKKSGFKRFLSDPAEYYSRFRGRSRPGPSPRELEDIPRQKQHIAHLQSFIQDRLGQKETIGSPTGPSRHRMLTIPINPLSESERADLAELRDAFDSARRLRLLSGPFMLLRAHRRRQTPWLELTNLSSGEQNLISTGARLIAHAQPGSFIAIDEPELSLNVAWQQRYIELIDTALGAATGSHVVIASHSPHLVASLKPGNSTVVVAELEDDAVHYSTHDGSFFGWGSEAILYKVLGIPSASNYEFTRELAAILLHIQNGGVDRDLLDKFIQKTNRIQVGKGDDALATVISEIQAYRKELDS